MNVTTERRRAPRATVNLPTLVEKLGHRELHLHPSLAALYERVHPDGENLGLKFPAAIHDLSVNGCFIAGQALPLLSRVACAFNLPGYGQVEAIGWVLWRRKGDCEIPGEGGGPATVLKAGFGLLYEAVPLDARLQIAKYIDHQQREARGQA
jgi:hypothetical protein